MLTKGALPVHPTYGSAACKPFALLWGDIQGSDSPLVLLVCLDNWFPVNLAYAAVCNAHVNAGLSIPFIDMLRLSSVKPHA